MNGLRHLEDSGNGGTTLEFLSPFPWRVPPLPCPLLSCFKIFPPTFRGAPFPPHSSRRGILSVCGRERIPGVPVASQEHALSTGKARGTPGSCHHSQSPPDVSVHSMDTCFPCTASTFTQMIDPHNGGTWDSPVGKPVWKTWWECPDGKPQIP